MQNGTPPLKAGAVSRIIKMKGRYRFPWFRACPLYAGHKGFSCPSANALILAFKQYWGVTPGGIPPEPSGPTAAQVREVTVDVSARETPLSSHWKRLFSTGYAKSLTDRSVQDQLRALQEEVGFEFIRVKGLLDDEMCLLRHLICSKKVWRVPAKN